MEIRNKKIGIHTYTLVNKSEGTRYGFRHITTLFKDNREVANNICCYYNRTWECYQFETSMRGAVSKYIDELLTRYLHAYKTRLGVKRFKKGEKEQVIEEFKAFDEIKELYALKDAISRREFD